MQTRAPNLLVFREDRRRVGGAALKRILTQEAAGLCGAPSIDKMVCALLRAGELECGAADAGDVLIEPYMQVTDRLAENLLAREIIFGSDSLCNILATAAVPDQVEIAPAEGFACYGVHPLAYAEVLARIPLLAPAALVIGIRSIGTTLSAVTAAALRRRGTKAERITVRPTGHPYNRKTRFSPVELASVQRHLRLSAVFLVVDEGPGLSGSSFLSVAEALVEAGAQPADIILVCGHEPDLDSLCADDGPQRARRFRWVAVSSQPRQPAGAEVSIGGGAWRRRLFRDGSSWPASWTTFERQKYLSPGDGGSRLFKFAGLGHYGGQVLEREEKVAFAGFGVEPHTETEGFASYPWMDEVERSDRTGGINRLRGRPMSAKDLSLEIIEHLARYCAFRADAFPEECRELSALEQMARHNIRQLGFVETPVRMKLERPVLADGRMQPHEWLLASGGRVLKTDSGSHGDDPFFPGVTDIAWDLAGTIVEWRMNAAESKALLECYRRASGDDAASRIPDFIRAYAVFRSAFCTMAASALRGSDEQARLERAAAEYWTMLRTQAR
jgi:hypothetical protein